MVSEPKTASFSLSRTFLGYSWKNDNRWSASILVGGTELLGIPKRYGVKAADFSLLEAYGQWDSGLGIWRVGQIPIEFGLEGGSHEEILIFPRSLIYQKGYLGLRDVGVSYYIKEGLFYTNLAIHNGEGGADRDNRAWLTGRWGVTPKNVDLGISAQVGQTTAQSTNIAGNASLDSLFSATENHRLRLANFYVSGHWDNWYAGSEIYLAEILTDNQPTTQFSGWHLDLKHQWSPTFQFLARYDEIRTYPATGREKTMQATLGIVLSNWNQTSSFFILATKVLDEPTEINNDRLQINWRWTPVPFDL